MASNTSKGKAKKGSKMLIQELINNKPDMINNILKDIFGAVKINWISPLSKENYKEYHLCDRIGEGNDRIYNKLGLDNSYKEYPGKGPEFDALAIAKLESGENISIFVEAKANIKELRSKCMSKNSTNRKKIEEQVQRVFKSEEIGSIDDTGSIFNEEYQLLNRYTYLNHYNNSRLVYIFFYSDESFINISKEEFENQKEKINKKLNEILINDINYDLKNRAIIALIDSKKVVE